jgi:hypothetical protein
MCFACYLRQQRGHSIDEPCAVCGLDDKRMLRRHRLAGGLVVLCANDAAVAGRRRLSLEELHAERFPAGDRRSGDRRRAPRRGLVERREGWDPAWELDADRRKDRRRAS